MALPPDKLGPFELLRRLGAGGMAETFLALRRGPAGFEQRVCIKRILPAYEADRDFVASFLVEARMSAALRHANIVQVVDFGEHEGSHYLALELIDGLDLRALVLRDAVLDAELVTLIAADIAAALAYAHADDEDRPAVIHRDVSPSNVLISRNGEVKLTDFGIARVIGGSLHTSSGIIKGKIPYMPPEYIDGGHFDPRGDVFALGVLMYELLHGYRPFDGDTEIETLRRIASGDRKPFTAPAPTALVHCVEQMIARNPAQRFVDARELLDALPTVHTHRARRRLADLVRARTLRVHGDVSPPSGWAPGAEHARTERIAPSGSSQGLREPETHPSVTATASSPARSVRPPAQRLMPSSRALWALAGSSALLLTVVLLALFRLPRGPSSEATPRPSPVVPGLPTVLTQPTEPPKATAPAATLDHDFFVPAEAPAKAEPPRKPEPPRTPEPTPHVVKASSESATSEEHASHGKHRAELTVVVVPFGEVWIDGKHVGEAPVRAYKLTPGTHEIGVGEGRASEKRIVELSAGQREELVFTRKRAP
ncbi:MAG TPA: protein kinase [Polyangiales bacterium]